MKAHDGVYRNRHNNQTPAEEQAMILVFVIVLGLVLGSFVNVVIHRGPYWWGLQDPATQRHGFGPRSRCPSCGAQIRSWDNIPLISFFLLRGRCRDCGAVISPLYLVVEGLGALVAVTGFALFGATPTGAAFAAYGFCLIALGAIDARTGFLPDGLTLPLLGFGLGFNALGDGFVPLADAGVGAAVGGGVFLAVALGYRALRGHDGLGLGDAKLLAAIGAWFGWPVLAPVVLLSSLSALAFLLVSARGKPLSATQEIRFGPALCFAGFCVPVLGYFMPQIS
ncbi:MAG: A24 family peptidase [Pseudomonadota bacterium]